MYKIDRTDFCILTAFKETEDDGNIIVLDKPIDGITITEIMRYLASMDVMKCRKTVYLHLAKLMKNDYVSKGIVNDHADTYYITKKGLQALKGESL